MIAIIANRKKYDCLKLLKDIKHLLKRLNVSHEIIIQFPFSQAEIKKIKLAKGWIILGGDGTILFAFAHFPKPPQGYVIAVNFGTVGYMAGIDEKKALNIIENYFLWQAYTNHTESEKPHKKLFKKEKIFTLFAESYTDKRSRVYYALNELVIRIGREMRPITIEVRINGNHIFKFRGDGIIVSTPTGSTAYNLSVGGPILAPAIEAFVLTFISAHSLTLKPIVVARDDTIELIIHDPAILAIDGAIRETIKTHHSIRCRLAEHPLTFVKTVNDTAYRRLKHKLHWGRL